MEHLNITIRQLETAQDLARKNIEKNQLYMKMKHNETAENQQYDIGDKVLLFCYSFYKGVSKKLMSKWYGPYIVTKQTGPLNYEIKDVNNPSHLERAHVARLKPYYNADDHVPNILYQEEETALPITDIITHSTDTAGNIQMQVRVEGENTPLWVLEEDVPLSLLKQYYDSISSLDGPTSPLEKDSVLSPIKGLVTATENWFL